MLKKELKILAKHKSVEPTSEIVDMISARGSVSTKKIVVTFGNGETRTLKPSKGDTEYHIKRWLRSMLKEAVMIEDYTGDERPDHVKDTYHRLGGLPDMWTFFMIFSNGEIV